MEGLNDSDLCIYNRLQLSEVRYVWRLFFYYLITNVMEQRLELEHYVYSHYVFSHLVFPNIGSILSRVYMMGVRCAFHWRSPRYLFIYDNFIRIKFILEPVQFARKLVGNCVWSPFLFFLRK